MDTSPYTDTDWHHWAGTFNTHDGLRCIYRDGVLVATDTNSNYAGSGDLWIGRAPISGSSFVGTIDEVRIWSVARSQAEIQADLGHPLTGTEANLLAYWKFDEASGAIAYDATTNHFDGTLVNDPPA